MALSQAEFKSLLKAAIDNCVTEARKYNTARALKGIPENDQAELKERFTHLKGDAYFEERKALYQKMFEHVFMPQGKLIEPVNSKNQKQRLFICGPFASGSSTIYSQLKHNLLGNSAKNAKNLYQQVHNHAVSIDFDYIRNSLPEYSTALAQHYTHASSVVRGEVSAISLAMIDLAKKCNYNIIENTGSFSSPISDEAIKEMQSGGYQLNFIGVTSKPNNIITWSDERGEETGQFIPYVQVAESISGFAHPDAFKKLMRHSKETLLLWNKNNKDFTPVAHTHEAKLKITNHAQWHEFDKQQYFSLSNSGVGRA